MGSRLAAAGKRWTQRFLTGIAWIAVFHPWAVLTGVLVVTAFSAYLASGLQLSTDIDSLLPKNVKSAERMRELFDRYGGSEPIVVAISGMGAEDVEDRIEITLTMREMLAESQQVAVVAGIFGEDPWELLDGPQIESLLLYLDPEQIDGVVQHLSSEAIEAKIEENRDTLRSPLGPVAGRLIREDPLGFLSLVLDKISKLKGALKIVPREGALVTEDESYVLLLIRPEGSSHDLEVARSMLSEIEDVGRRALEELDLEGSVGMGLAPADAPEGAIHIGLTGAPALLVDYHEILQRDIRSISGVAFLAVLALFLLAFRRLSGVIVAGVPLAVGVIWSMAFARLLVGEINVFTAGSVAILCGLAIDFTIHLYNRYLEEAHSGHDMWRAFQASHGEAGLGILAAAVTTAWAFMAAGMSRFRGLRDLGLICAAGIVLSLLASFLLVPALTAIAARLRPGPDKPKGLASFGLTPVLRFVTRRPRTVVALSLVITVLLAWPAISVRVDDDFRKFRPNSAPSIQLQRELGTRAGTSLQPIAALVSGQSDDEILEASSRIEQEFTALIGEGESSLTAVIGPASIVPPPSRQRAVLELLRRHRADGTLVPEQVEARLLESLARNGFRMDQRARTAARRVRKLLSVDEELTLARAEEGPLHAVLEDLLVARPEGGRDALITAYPRPNAGTTALVASARDAVERSGVHADLIGGRILSAEIKPLVIRDGIRAAVISGVGVLLILLLILRRPILVLMTFVPLLVSVFASVGLMDVIGVDFNLVSISMVPLILGIGIDNGIHVVHRFREHDGEDLVEVFQHTGRGIVMTSLTTMVGFGALIFADYPGLISSGVLAILGVGTTLVAAVTILPALLTLIRVRP